MEGGRASLPKELQAPDAQAAGEYLFFERAKTLEAELADGRPYLLGEQFTVADIVVGQTLFWARSQRLENPGPLLTAYRDRLKARDAFVRVKALLS